MADSVQEKSQVFVVSPSPHIQTTDSVRKIMWTVGLSLLPAGAAGVYLFGMSALNVILVAVVSAMLSEAVLQALTKRKIAVRDGSAFVTGLLLAYNLPPEIPLWIPFIGSFVSIAIGKQIFGGLGQNIFNPALVGRVFLMACWPKYMTSFVRPYDAVASATPLAALREGKIIEHLSTLDLFLGRRGGCIGEVCIAALLIGAALLFAKRYISWHIPVSYMGTTAVLVFAFGGTRLFTGDWLFHMLTGGLVLGALFMATDYVTSPLTAKGQLFFGIGCGVLTAVIRLWGGYPEGVSYAILMMNAATPIIDRFTKSRVYGAGGEQRA
jgi:Na+-translocating ferredoxin:NAD+ oxidoreductase subunit D